MSSESRFSGAEVDLVMHATENEGRILHVIQDHLSVSPERFSYSASDGHYKNRILYLRALLSSPEANELAVRMISLLGTADREDLARNIYQHSDERGNFYLRLDKQRLCRGKVALSSTDSVRIKFKPIKRYKSTSNIESYRGLLSSTE